ncbi:hypothetical protein [Actibacterium sp. D379-3]
MALRVAVCFFGITRSLTRTIGSIEANVLAPARAAGKATVYAHFFEQTTVDNPRSGERGTMVAGEHALLHPDWLRLEPPETCLDQWDFAGLKAYGDEFEDGFRSLRNLVHQLHSINIVARAALADGADICLFCRPDLRYHDSLHSAVARAAKTMRQGGAGVWLPYWGPYGGANDRFAVCAGEPAIRAWGTRIGVTRDFCQAEGRPLHSESLVRYALDRAGVARHGIKGRASRVRIDGTEMPENFDHPAITRMKDGLGPVYGAMNRLPGTAGLRKILGRRVHESD